jgi:flagellar biosynthesis anti-sigma factor FlgM
MKVKGAEPGKLGSIMRKRAVGAQGVGGMARGARASAPGSSGSDDVQLSSDARLFGVANEALHAAPEIRTELVESIREALTAGRYSVSSLDVADKMLRQVLIERGR